MVLELRTGTSAFTITKIYVVVGRVIIRLIGVPYQYFINVIHFLKK